MGANLSDTKSTAEILQIHAIGRDVTQIFLERLGLLVEWVADGLPIPGSFWGAPEAGIIGTRVFLRTDTPVHSMLHEVCHILCMSADRRMRLNRDAGSDDLEEAAVCYLQIVLANYLPGVGSERLMHDMDAWGYSFRLGSTKRWFVADAEDARAWLYAESLIDAADAPTFRMRSA